jgi:signal transduction histidine kinase
VALMMSVAFEDLQAFADALPMPFWVASGKDGGYRIAVWNNAAERTYEYTKAEAIKASFLELFVEDFLRERAARDCDNVIAGTFTHPPNVITLDRSKSHARLVMLTNVFRLKYAGNVYQAEMSIDFTSSSLDAMIMSNYRELIREADSSPEVRQLTYLLQRRLDQEHEQVNTWAAGVMHDIRTEAGSAGDHLISYRRRVEKANSDRDMVFLDNMIRSLQFRADAFIGVYGGGLSNPTNATFEAWEVLNLELSLLEEYGPTIFHASIEFTQEGEGGTVQLRGRPEAFRQCVYNLLQNACRHMRTRGDRYIRVGVDIDNAAQQLILTITNPGQIAAEQMEPEDHAEQRISLGLRLVRDVAEEVGGSLTHENSEHNGTPVVRACLRWPLAPATAAKLS